VQVVFLGVGLAADSTVGNGESQIQEVNAVTGGCCCPSQLAKAQVRFESVKWCIRHCRFPYDEAIIYESFVEEQWPTVAIGGEQCSLVMIGVVDGGEHTCY